MRAITDLLQGVLGIMMIPIMILLSLGNIYWLWMAIQIGSFSMFVVGMFPLFIIVTAPVGGWSLVFGMPHWVYSFFG